HECVEVAGVRCDIVVSVRADLRVAEAAQVGNDDLEPRLGKGSDVSPPDPLRLRPAVHEDDGESPNTFPHEGLPEAARTGVLDLERAGVQLVVGHATTSGGHDTGTREDVTARP